MKTHSQRDGKPQKSVLSVSENNSEAKKRKQQPANPNAYLMMKP